MHASPVCVHGMSTVFAAPVRHAVLHQGERLCPLPTSYVPPATVTTLPSDRVGALRADGVAGGRQLSTQAVSAPSSSVTASSSSSETHWEIRSCPRFRRPYRP
ncbi:MAG: hypothetical protein ACLSVD_02035 [Eggerthellaceae bacterium]